MWCSVQHDHGCMKKDSRRALPAAYKDSCLVCTKYVSERDGGWDGGRLSITAG